MVDHLKNVVRDQGAEVVFVLAHVQEFLHVRPLREPIGRTIFEHLRDQHPTTFDLFIKPRKFFIAVVHEGLGIGRTVQDTCRSRTRPDGPVLYRMLQFVDRSECARELVEGFINLQERSAI